MIAYRDIPALHHLVTLLSEAGCDKETVQMIVESWSTSWVICAETRSKYAGENPAERYEYDKAAAAILMSRVGQKGIEQGVAALDDQGKVEDRYESVIRFLLLRAQPWKPEGAANG